MSGALPPEQQQLLVAGYVLGDLDAEEAALFEQQLAADPSLRQVVAQLQQSLEHSYNPPEVSPPPLLRQRVLATYRRQHRQPARQPARRPWARGLGIAAAFAILGLSLSNYLLWRDLQRLRIASAETLQLTLQPTTAELPASVQLAVDPDTLEATVNVEDLPPLPEGQVYVLWTVLSPGAPFTTDDKNAILTQVFTVDDQGHYQGETAVPAAFRTPDVVTAVAITIEQAADPQRHRAAPILIEQL